MVEVNFVDVLARKGFRCKGPAVFHARGTEQFDACLAEFAKVRDSALLAMFNGIVLIDLESASPLVSSRLRDRRDGREPPRGLQGRLRDALGLHFQSGRGGAGDLKFQPQQILRCPCYMED